MCDRPVWATYQHRLYAHVRREPEKKFATDPTRYAMADVVEFDPKAPVFGKPASADAVLTFVGGAG